MRNLILACIMAVLVTDNPLVVPSTTQGTILMEPDGTLVQALPEDPWNYDYRLAPEGVELLGAYNGRTITYSRVIRWDSSGWQHKEPLSGGYYDRSCGIPDAWMAIPTPQKFPKLVEGKTKEQVEQMLKEFDE